MLSGTSPANRLLDYLPFRFSVFLSLGIFSGYRFQHIELPSVAVYLPFALLPVFYVLSRRMEWMKYVFFWSAYVFFFLYGFTAIRSRLPAFDPAHFSHYTLEGNFTVHITGRLPSSAGFRYSAEVVEAGGHPVRGNILFIVTDSGIENPPVPGNYYAVAAKILPLNHAVNPYAFDYAGYLEKKNTAYRCYVTRGQFRRVEWEGKSWFDRAQVLRSHILSSLEAYRIPGREFAVMKALLLGEKSGLEYGLKERYARAGLVHILAVSGLHVGILFLFINLLLGWMPNYPSLLWLRTGISVFVLWGYAFFTGLSPSVTRAVLMFSIIGVGMRVQRSLSLLRAAAFACFIMLTVHPFYLLDPGFQLSFTAVGGIGLFYHKILKLFPFSHPWIRYFTSLVSVSLSATLGTLPLTIYYFHRFPALFLVSNILIVPWLGVVMGLGFVISIWAGIWTVPQWIVDTEVFLLKVMNTVTDYLAGLDGFVLEQLHLSTAGLVVAYAVILALGYWWGSRNYGRMLAVLVSVLLFQLILVAERYRAYHTSECVVFHRPGYSMLGIRDGKRMRLWTDLDSLSLSRESAWAAYRAHYGGLEVSVIHGIPPFLSFGETLIQVIDSTGVYFPAGADVVVVRKSPYLHPVMVSDSLGDPLFVLDGSNRYRIRELWQNSLSNVHLTHTAGAWVKQIR